MKEFVKEVVNNLQIGPDATEVGLITFSKYPTVRIALGSVENKADLLTKVDEVPYQSGKSLSSVFLIRCGKLCWCMVLKRPNQKRAKY